MFHSIDEEFHVSTRNSAASKSQRSSHLVHYADHVQEMVAQAPHRVAGSRRFGESHGLVPKLDMPLEQALAQRASSRWFDGAPIAFGALWRICDAAVGVREVLGTAPLVAYQRNAPNSGGLGSVELYTVVLNVLDLPPGIYHFDSVARELVLLLGGDFSSWLDRDVLFQSEFARASAALVLTSSFGPLRAKYGPRGYRSALLDAGHCSENIYLSATSLGLQVCATTGFIDDELDEALGLDGLTAASVVVLLVGQGRSKKG